MSSRIIRGVNPLFTILRSCVCSGGSMFSMSIRDISRPSGSGSSMSALPRHDENVALSRLTVSRSSWRVMHQKCGRGEPSGYGCLKTGASRRRSSNCSCGTPGTKVSGSYRSMSASSTVPPQN